jgi:hypothetical protein
VGDADVLETCRSSSFGDEGGETKSDHALAKVILLQRSKAAVGTTGKCNKRKARRKSNDVPELSITCWRVILRLFEAVVMAESRQPEELTGLLGPFRLQRTRRTREDSGRFVGSRRNVQDERMATGPAQRHEQR